MWQESKFKEALRWSVNILKLEPSNAIISEYQVTYAAQHAALYLGRVTVPAASACRRRDPVDDESAEQQ
jgi:hypothetical protein